MIETLFMLLIWLVVLGVVFWLLTSYVLPALPIAEPFKAAIVAILAIIVILLLVMYFLPAPGLRLR